MKKLVTMVALLVAVLCAVPQSVDACGYGPPRPLWIFASADVIIKGKVVRIEDRPQFVHFTGNPKPQEMMIAIVKIDEAIKGATGLTHLRIACFGHDAMKVGSEQCFCLVRHEEESLYFLTSRSSALRNVKTAKGMVAEFRDLAKLRQSPVKSLSSECEKTRMRATALMILEAKRHDYRSGKPKMTTMRREISRLILLNLSKADWVVKSGDFETQPLSLFYQLGVKKEDGWNPQELRGHSAVIKGAKKWCAAHASTFKISAFVREQ